MKNREIKFRVWIKSAKEWLETESPIYCVFNHENILELYSTEDYVFQQFTNLKDKNAREIYEGDIILSEYFSTYENKYVKCKDVVCFQDGHFVAKAYNLYEKDNYAGGFLLDSRYLEVVGNVFENPELLC